MPPLVDLSALVALGALLVVAYAHPRRQVEAGVSLAAAGAAVVIGTASGVVDGAALTGTVERLLPVVGFLAAILVVAEVCDRAGLFVAAGRLLRGSPVRVLTVAFVAAALVTTTLSLDATVVLLTPVVVAAAVGPAAVAARAGSYACLRMANSGSLLLPVSNLTNLLAVPYLGLTFVGFATTMAPVLAAVLLVEYVGLRLLLARDLAAQTVPTAPSAAPAATRAPHVPWVPVAAVLLMLVGFVVTSPLHVEPWVVSGIAAAGLVAWARPRALVTLPEVVRAARPEFALLVLALGLVVTVLDGGFLADAVRDLLPSHTSYVALLGLAALATLLANALTNLSAALLLLPLVAPLGDTALLAALIGLNVGSGLTLSGSLANLLWRRTLAATGHARGLLELHLVALALTPVSLLAAVSVLWWVS